MPPYQFLWIFTDGSRIEVLCFAQAKQLLDTFNLLICSLGLEVRSDRIQLREVVERWLGSPAQAGETLVLTDHALLLAEQLEANEVGRPCLVLVKVDSAQQLGIVEVAQQLQLSLKRGAPTHVGPGLRASS